jgi:hypothetical protein
MPFQSTVNINYAFGLIGQLYKDGPTRAQELLINSSGAVNNVGYAFTKSNATNVATVGGAITNGSTVFAGILISPKSYAAVGTSAGGTLAATLAVPDNTLGEFLTMGDIVVALTGAANIGDQVQYNTTTGALSAVAPGASASGGNALVPNAVVIDFQNTAAGIAAIRLTN